MKASVFPGQGAQFVGMGLDLYNSNDEAKKLFDRANEILGFPITKVIFEGTEEDLKQTKVTQPAVFLHSYISAIISEEGVKADMMAGHSLGEFTALAVSGALSFEDALTLVSRRAQAMQRACELAPSTMAAILGLEDELVESLCANVAPEVVILANYNSPGQAVISGSVKGVNEFIELAKEAGAKRAIPLNVSGAFHSPFMESARIELEEAINSVTFSAPTCPIYQNVDALPHTNTEEIRANLIKQLTSPVRWTQSVRNMVADGATEFTEYGPGNVLQGLIKRIIK
ncbi:ACP S-malonyltransferase [Porphyromonadaceae bacterium W3.11]|nr:ACP S-malonyltransferase [Porphyromonadaceae bacterium W3.11]